MASAPPAGIRPTAYLPELESLRGVAILLVVAFHADAMVRAKGMRPPGDDVSLPLAFVRAGHSGVDLFFVLSAFLLSLPFLAEMAGGRRVGVRAYRARSALPVGDRGGLGVSAARSFAADALAADRVDPPRRR